VSTGVKVRAWSLKTIDAVLSKGKSLQVLLAHYPEQFEPRDQALAKQLCFGVLRFLPRLEGYLGHCTHKPVKNKKLQLILLLGIYQLHAMRVPDYAVIATSLKLVTQYRLAWAKKMVHGILSQFIKEEARIVEACQTINTHPEWLSEAISSAWPEQANLIFEENDRKPPMHLRVNLQKITSEAYLTLLADEEIQGSANPYFPAAITLSQPVSVKALPQFEVGAVSVQDLAPQMVPNFLDLQPELKVLDACAAPGGKTCHMLEVEPSLSVVAADISKERSVRLAENLTRLGLSAEYVCADLSQPDIWPKHTFDRILLDAPCSATGVIRRHPDIKWLRQQEDIEALALMQYQLLKNLWPTLKPGGVLLYATCSVLPAENDQVIEAFLQECPSAKVELISSPYGIKTSHGWQILPTQQGPDGFYYAKLVK